MNIKPNNIYVVTPNHTDYKNCDTTFADSSIIDKHQHMHFFTFKTVLV